MAKTRQIYVCDQCGNESLQWQGLCPACGAGDSLKAISVAKGGPDRKSLTASTSAPQRLSQVLDKDDPRIATGLEELDRVLGGGLVLGSVTLLGGDPGIGKSTLLLQAVASIASGPGAAACAYISGEEAIEQVRFLTNLWE